MGIREKFIEALETGWDEFVDTYKAERGKNFWTDLYEYAYKYMENGDPDAGTCFLLRHDAVLELYRDIKDILL